MNLDLNFNHPLPHVVDLIQVLRSFDRVHTQPGWHAFSVPSPAHHHHHLPSSSLPSTPPSSSPQREPIPVMTEIHPAWMLHTPNCRRKRTKRNRSSSSSSRSSSVSTAKVVFNTRVCSSCGVTDTVQWRKGPDGKASMCNACGQRFKRRRLAEERSLQRRHEALGHAKSPHHSLEPASPPDGPHLCADSLHCSAESILSSSSCAELRSPSSGISQRSALPTGQHGQTTPQRRSDIHFILN